MSSSEGRSSKVANIALWVLQVALAAMFLMAGFGKLMGDQLMVENFDKIGLGQWFRYLTGSVELLAGVLLVIPRLSGLGAALLLSTMIGACVFHFTLLGGSAIPAVVFGVLAAIVLYGRRQTLFALIGSSQDSSSKSVAEAI